MKVNCDAKTRPEGSLKTSGTLFDLLTLGEFSFDCALDRLARADEFVAVVVNRMIGFLSDPYGSFPCDSVTVTTVRFKIRKSAQVYTPG